MNPTLDYYNRNADAYAQRTAPVDIVALTAPFLALLPSSARILDAGCGPGRNAAHFLRLGHHVTTIDASAAMVRLATQAMGQPALLLPFDQIGFEAEFDGVWANASLLHISRARIDAVLARLVCSLKPGGILYFSVKFGPGEWTDPQGRFFCDYTEQVLHDLLARHPAIQVIEIRRSSANQFSLDDKEWLRTLTRKTEA